MANRDPGPLLNAPAPARGTEGGAPALRYVPELNDSFPGYQFVSVVVDEGERVVWYVDAASVDAPDVVAQRISGGGVAREVWEREWARAGGAVAADAAPAAPVALPVASVGALWARWGAWLEAHAPEMAARLPVGASTSALDEAEAALGRALPADVRALYAAHDGDGAQRYELGIVGNWALLSLGVALETWRERGAQLDAGVYEGPSFEANARGPVRASWWRWGWLPIVDNGSSDHLCVDLDPADGGAVGQVIRVWNRSARREVVAPSVAAWMAAVVGRLEDGTYRLVVVPGGGVAFYDSGF